MHIRVYAEKRVKQKIRIFAIHTHLSLCLIVLANFCINNYKYNKNSIYYMYLCDNFVYY